MMSRILALVAFCVMSIALTVSGTRDAHAQAKSPGTVSWAAGFPAGGGGAGGVTGFQVQGTFTTSVGWTVVGNPGVYWIPKAGGTQKAEIVDTNAANQWGELKGGVMGPKFIPEAAGTYTVYASFVFKDAAGNTQNVQTSHLDVIAK